uniref:Cleavage and polyadenylation specificity factor subunit 2 n=1 Tax=Amorphochlora amoebiformis TaxID=1561963 RepID=A0A7S0D528_9EUKA
MTQFTIKHVREAIDRMKPLKFSQDVILESKKPEEDPLTVTPYAAGRIIGGCFWHINFDSGVIIYAVEFNHRTEQHLNRFVLEAFSRPTLLITDATCMSYPTERRQSLDSQLFQAIQATLSQGADVLIPVDAGGRVLELLLCLYRFWIQAKMDNHGYFIFSSRVAESIIEYAKSLAEWMSDSCRNDLNNTHRRPFQFGESLKVALNLAEIDRYQGPKLILATNESLIGGYSLKIWKKLLRAPPNLLIVPQRGQYGSPTQQFFFPHRPKYINLKIRKLLPTRLLPAQTKPTITPANKDTPEESTAEKSQENNNSGPSKPKPNLTGVKVEKEGGKMVKKRKRKKKAKFPLFSFKKEERKYDDYGEIIDPEDFKVPEEAMTPTPDMARVNKRFRGPNPNPNQDFTPMRGGAGGGPPGPKGPFMDVGRRARFGEFQGNERNFQQGERNFPPGERNFPKGERNFQQNEMFQGNPGGNATGAGFKSGLEGAKEPMTMLWDTQFIRVHCRILCLNYEGRSDGKAVKNTLSQVKPHNLIILRGSVKDKGALRKYMEDSQRCKVMVPQNGQMVHAISGSETQRAVIHPTLSAKLEFKSVDPNMRIAWMNALLQDGEEKKSEMRMLIPAPEARVRGHAALYLGNVKFAGLQRLLIEEGGLNANFHGNIMVCNNGQITIQKKVSKAKRSIRIEGGLSEDYYKVRKLLVSQYTVL